MEEQIKKILLKSLERGEVNKEWLEQKNELFRAVRDLLYLEDSDNSILSSPCDLDVIHFDIFAVICHTKNVIAYCPDPDNGLKRLILLKTEEKYFDDYFAFLQTLLPYELDKLERVLLRKFLNWSFDNACLNINKTESRIFLYDLFTGKEQVIRIVSLLNKNIAMACPKEKLEAIFAKTYKKMLVGK